MEFRVFVLGLTFLISGCASNHSGYLAEDQSENKIKDKTLVISAEQSFNLSSEYFGYIVVTFENQTGEWFELSDLNMDFPGEDLNGSIKPLSGEKLVQWQRSISLRNRIRNHNESLALGSLLVVGALSSSSNNKSTSRVGTNTMLATAGVTAVKNIGENVEKISNSQAVPDTHLAGDILVPPMLSTKKWIVFNTKEPHQIRDIGKFVLTFRDQNNKRYKFNVKYYSRRSFN